MQHIEIMQNCPTVNLNNKTSGYASTSRAHLNSWLVALNNVKVIVIQGESLRLIGFLA